MKKNDLYENLNEKVSEYSQASTSENSSSDHESAEKEQKHSMSKNDKHLKGSVFLPQNKHFKSKTKAVRCAKRNINQERIKEQYCRDLSADDIRLCYDGQCCYSCPPPPPKFDV